MTDNEIKKALGCCMHSKWSDKCSECFYAECDSEKGCVKELLEDALDLINHQQAEIERLQKLLEGWKTEAYKVADEKDKLYCAAVERVKATKAEAIKEFWSRLQGVAYRSETEWSYGEHPMLIELDDAEDIYEEMVGDAE